VVVESIDKDMAGSPELATRIRDGLAQLSKAAGGDFTAVNAEKQVEAMQILEGTPFFSDMLNKTQFYFYNNKTVWPKWGLLILGGPCRRARVHNPGILYSWVCQCWLGAWHYGIPIRGGGPRPGSSP
jgi:hypothetical protein